MKTILLLIAFMSFSAFADTANSSKLFNCLSWYRDTLSLNVKSETDITVFNQFDYQVTYTPSEWIRSDLGDVGSFVLTNTMSAVLKYWDNADQKWKYTNVPETVITIEFKNNEPISAKSSFMNLNCPGA